MSHSDEVTAGMRRSRGQSLAYTLGSLVVLFILVVWFAGQSVGASGGGQNVQTFKRSNVQTFVGPTPPGCDPAWNIAASPNLFAVTNVLYKVAAVSSSDVWAVGYSSAPTATLPLIVHWNGVQWSGVSTPNIGTDARLYGLDTISANDVWAVGSRLSAPGGVSQTLTLHWNGSQWSVVPSLNVGISNNGLSGVTSVASNDVWIVGYSTEGFSNRSLIEHWDGVQWSLAIVPQIGDRSALSSVDALSTSDIWAVGYFAVFEFSQPLTLHWDGHTWTQVPTPLLVSDGGFGDVGVVAANDVWAVGNEDIPIIEHWDGAQWSLVPYPDLGTGGDLRGVAIWERNDLWIVGRAGPDTNAQTVTLHWDGTQFALEPSPNPSATGNIMFDAAALSANEAWAVGNYETVAATRTLAEHYVSVCVTPQPSPTPSATSTSTITSTPTTTSTPTITSTSTSTPTSTLTPSPQPPTPTSTATLCPLTFSDVGASDYFYEAVRHLYCHGAISGYIDGSFRPYYNTTRGQLCKIVVLAMGWPINVEDSPHFTDVPTTHPFFIYIETAFNRGAVVGYTDATFRPSNNVTRGQLCKIIVLANEWSINTEGGPHFSDVETTNTFYDFIETAYNRSIITGYSDGTFRPGANTTRGQICKIVYLAIRE